MKETLYPTLEEALYLHDILIRRFGGKQGVLDKGSLESALARPRSGYYRSLSEQAAALMQSLAMNHPFVDGNKRVAFALTAIFLKLNGLSLKVDAKSGGYFVEVTLIKERAPLDVITSWIEQRTK
jgi:death on curing protein